MRFSERVPGFDAQCINGSTEHAWDWSFLASIRCCERCGALMIDGVVARIEQ